MSGRLAAVRARTGASSRGRGRGLVVALVVVLGAALGGCLVEPGVTCADGTACPDGTTCATVAGATYCATADQLARCAEQADGAPCPIAGQDVGVCRDHVCVRAGCGDGLVSGAEQCDLRAPAERDTCGEVGYYNVDEPVGCTDDCRLDTSACRGTCGDGLVNGDEQCDGADLGLTDGNADGVIDCEDAGFHDGEVICLDNCQRNLIDCQGRCGDGARTAGEACDGSDFGADTCTARGFYTGTLTCAADCASVSTAACTGTCGDGVVNGPERCDGTAFPVDVSCELFGYYRGQLGCTPACDQVTTDGCAGFCGDGTVDVADGELCDGLAQFFTDGTCASAGAVGFGPLGCDRLCHPTFDRCEAGAWTDVPGVDEPARFSDLWASGNDDLWATIPLGASTRVRRHVEGRWVALPDVGARLEAIWSGGGLTLAGGAGGALYRLVRAPAPPFALSWQVEVAGTAPGETITDLWGTGPDDVYLTTSTGRILHRAAGSWSQEAAVGGELRAIAGDGRGFVMAAGASRLAFLQPGGWAWITLPGQIFDALSVRSPYDAWVVGHDVAGRLVRAHFDGVILHDEQLAGGPFGAPGGVLAGAADDVWVLGANGPGAPGGLRLRYDGVRLAVQPTGNLFALTEVAGVDGGDVWAAEWNALTGRATLDHLDGHGWRRRSLDALIGEPALDVVVQDDQVWYASAERLVGRDPRRTTTDPDLLTTLVPPGGGSITALWATPTARYAFVGSTVWRHAEGAWTAHDLAGPPVVDAWGRGEQVFAVGGDRLYWFDGASWHGEQHGANLRAVSGTASDVWLLGDGVHRRTGPGQYVDLPPMPLPLVGRSIHAASPAYVVVAGNVPGAIASVVTWTGGAWELGPQPTGVLYAEAITGSSPRDLWLVGHADQLGQTAHWDGTTWTPVPLPTGTAALHAAAARAPGDVWAVGDVDLLAGDVNARGVLVHLDHRLASLTGGACAAAPPIACPGTIAVTHHGAIVDGPVAYVLDASFTGTLQLEATGPTAAMEVRVLPRGQDGTCDRAAPLAAGPGPLEVPIVRGQRYYVEVAPVAEGATGGYHLAVACRRP